MKRLLAALIAAATMAGAAELPEKTVVLTFDDAVKSHVTFVAPALKERGFGATFYVTHRWMEDGENFLTWEDVAAIHAMGFEIGNHTWTHQGFASPAEAARLEGELALVEYALAKVGVPKPVTFAWPGNAFCIEGVRVLEKLGYQLARRGMQPEMPYGRIEIGPRYEPDRHHRLLIPTTGDAYPDWTLDHFKKLVHTGKPGQPVILQFHGVPDVAHPWVHTDPDRFIEFMDYLKAEGFNTIALRDLIPAADAHPEAKGMPAMRYPLPKDGVLKQAPEVEATRNDLRFWVENMLVHHGYAMEEAAEVAGWEVAEFEQIARAVTFDPEALERADGPGLRVLPYPGGRHPRIGFLEGAVAPQRGTKASIFPPWPNGGYAVLDVPEAIWRGGDLIYLAHTHIPTYWDARNERIYNIDWTRTDTGLTLERTLPNNVSFGARLTPGETTVDIDLWVRNGTDAILEGLRAQVCLMLKELRGFAAQANENKTFEAPVTAVRNDDGTRWVIIAFTPVDRCWGNAKCPCAHADPSFPDAAPGETQTARGRIWFHEGAGVETRIAEARSWAEGAE
ncbi:MAG: polysaccharide deacetylase family protein [Candidatus Hydrogenedentes bacterium]|nr:polysaccharide deacetylase family protein [Candidatus Hydrogenedentota bacterium]